MVFNKLSKKFQGSYKRVSAKFQGYFQISFNGVSRKIEGSFQWVLRVFEEVHRNVKKVQMCFKKVLRGLN